MYISNVKVIVGSLIRHNTGKAVLTEVRSDPPIGVLVRFLRALLEGKAPPLMSIERSAVSLVEWRAEMDRFENWYSSPVRTVAIQTADLKDMDPDEKQKQEYMKRSIGQQVTTVMSAGCKAFHARMKKEDWYRQAYRQIIVSTLLWRSDCVISSGSAAVESIWSEYLSFVCRRGASRISVEYFEVISDFYFFRRYFLSNYIAE